MLIRVYALYNRGSVVLWTMGAFLVLSIIMNVTLVCRITIARADRFNALFQRWLGVLQDDVPKDAPPPPRCVPYRSFQECVFSRTFLKYSHSYRACPLVVRIAEGKVGYFVILSSYLNTDPACCRK